MQSEIRTTPLVGYRETIATDPDLTLANDRKTHASRAHDNDAAVATAMGSDAGDRCIVRVNNGPERMRLPYEAFERALTADASKTDGSMR
jgi:hypothetical protein